MKRFNMVFPDGLFAELEAKAQAKSVTVTSLLKVYARLGLRLSDAQDAGNKIIVRDSDGKETQFLLFE